MILLYKLREISIHILGKLNIDISNMIRSIRSNEKLSYDKIAKMFDVSKATIINICKNRIYT